MTPRVEAWFRQANSDQALAMATRVVAFATAVLRADSDSPSPG